MVFGTTGPGEPKGLLELAEGALCATVLGVFVLVGAPNGFEVDEVGVLGTLSKGLLEDD